MLFKSYALVITHGDARIPLPSGIPKVCELIEHLDRVFLNLCSEQNKVPLLYATIPWSPDQLQREQAAAEEARPPPPPSYNNPPLHLSSLRGLTDNWDRLLAATDRSLDVLHVELGHLHRGLAEDRIDQLSGLSLWAPPTMIIPLITFQREQTMSVTMLRSSLGCPVQFRCLNLQKSQRAMMRCGAQGESGSQ
ncbi:uncharacterized protein C8Q71DRAFT_863831 [Rhodofomes roseus]|uniref:Uncharacterized protein n=1 Tax=Rhodofomes roseus TaxID=34475 RepID=A0ABQ8JX62_9APHY|nr:uncharacterized protein C8Q71DRAFT_863831 [Rhodofomes roseus]KAH9828652.1 hypothetical protein C8Q71DRAFT_863831 [Rhodofomes roseus]